MTLPDEYVEVDDIGDFEKWVGRLEGEEWDFIAVYPMWSGKYVEFRRGSGDRGRFFILFAIRGKAVVDRVRLYCSDSVIIEDGVVRFSNMRVKIEVFKRKDGASDIDINVVEWKEMKMGKVEHPSNLDSYPFGACFG